MPLPKKNSIERSDFLDLFGHFNDAGTSDFDSDFYHGERISTSKYLSCLISCNFGCLFGISRSGRETAGVNSAACYGGCDNRYAGLSAFGKLKSGI